MSENTEIKETLEVKEEQAEPEVQETKDAKEQILDEFLKASEEEEPKKSHKGLVIALLVVVLAAAAGLGYKFIFVPQQQYNAADALFQSGQYEEAADAFIAMNGYKDSDDRAMECYNYMAYSIATELFNLGDYDTALTAFIDLGDFMDAADQAQKIQNLIDEQEQEKAALYDEGYYALENGEPEIAIRKLKKLDEDYEDVSSLLLKAKHQLIVQNFGSTDAAKYLTETLQTYDPVMTADEIKELFAADSLYLRDPDLYIHDYYAGRSMIGTEVKFTDSALGSAFTGYTIAEEGEAQNITWNVSEEGLLSLTFDNKKAMATGHESPDALEGNLYELADGAYLYLVEPKIEDGKAICTRALILIKKDSSCAKRIENAL